MWERVRMICPTASPTSMIMDFENAAINAFQMEWPKTTVKGCYFHFTQNVWRKIQELGLQTDYMNDEQLALRIRMLPALAFAPPFEVQELFPQVIEQLGIPASVELALYFEATYIGRTVPGGTQLTPLFPIKMWNHHHDVPQGIPRTTNAVEAWHRAYNATIGCHHPNIWKWINAIRREQGLVEVKQAKFLAGDKPSKRTKNSANEEGLTNLVLSYFHLSPMEFLQGIAHRLNFGTN